MASRSADRRPPEAPLDDLDNYDVDDDPFAGFDNDTAAGQDGGNGSRKRKEAADLGIDEEIAVKKKARAPAVKLDESRLLSEKGIPRLRRKAQDLKFKGKGHEFSDAARLLSFYQLWLDDLFPKAKFLDALNMVEKTGHKKYMRIKRLEWIDEGKPRLAAGDEDDEHGGDEARDPASFPARVAPIFATNGGDGGGPRTPPGADADDLFGDDDPYDATPRASRTGAGAGGGGGGEPDEDDLDALMAEDEAQRGAQTQGRPSAAAAAGASQPYRSMFGNGRPAAPPGSSALPRGGGGEPDEDEDLDALMAEAEAHHTAPLPSRSAASAAAVGQRPPPRADDNDDGEDDLDALMAEAEASGPAPQREKPAAPAPAPEDQEDDNADDEEAMAEMEGLF